MRAEWSHDGELPWGLLETAEHANLRRMVCDLAKLYRQEGALHLHDFDAEGFEWVDCHDVTQSTVSYLRHGARQSLLVILNFTPVVRHGYRVGVPRAGHYEERLNSDATVYGGSNVGNQGGIEAESTPWMGQPYSLSLTLPPLGALVLRVPGQA
jgi:1,4-alpha-glucan branching enzyme